MKNPLDFWRLPLIASACLFTASVFSIDAGAHALGDLVASQEAGTWQLTNQNTFQEVWVPADRRPTDSATPRSVINAWNGGAYDPTTGDYFIFGGDNTGYQSNEVYRWRGSTLKWQRDSLPSQTRPNMVLSSGMTQWLTVDGVDHSPITAETYDNLVFLPKVNRFAVMGGAAYPGAGTPYLREDGITRAGPYFFDPARADPLKVGGVTGSHVNPDRFPEVTGGEMWENRQSIQPSTGMVGPKTQFEGVTAYAELDGKDTVFVGEAGGGGIGRLFKYTVNSLSPSDDQWELVGIQGPRTFSGPGAGAYDSKRNAFVRTAKSNVIVFDPATNTFVTKSKYVLAYWNLQTPGAQNPAVYIWDLAGESFPLSSWYGMDYDPNLDAFVLWQGDKDVWLVYPPNQLGFEGWRVARHTPVGTGPALGGFTFTGVFGKWNYMADSEAFLGVVNDVRGDAWVYKPDMALRNVSLPSVYLPAARPDGSGNLELILANPANPGSPYTLQSGMSQASLQRVATIAHGVSTAPRSTTGRHPRTLVYVVGHKLMKVDLVNEGEVAPVQLSSESAADQICAFEGTAENYGDHNESILIYSLPGVDGDCASSADNEFRMVRLSFGPTDAPLPAMRPLTPLFDTAHTPIGWLASEGVSLGRYSQDFSSREALESFSGNPADLEYLGVDAAGAVSLIRIGSQLRAFNQTTGQLGGALLTFSGGSRPKGYTQDAGFTYIVDRNASQSQIYAVRSDASAAPKLVVSESFQITGLPQLFQTSSRMAYIVRDSATPTYRVRVIPKLGGTIGTLATGVAGDFLQVAGATAFYNIALPSGTRAGRVGDTGLGRVEMANSRWLGGLFPSSGELAGTNPVRLLRLDRSTPSNDGGASVSVVDPNSYAVETVLGVLPARIGQLTLGGGTPIAPSLVGTATVEGSTEKALFYLDSETAGSLTELGIAIPIDSGGPNQPPTARINISPSIGTTATTFSFDGSSSSDSDGTIVSYAWNFGDGSVANGANKIRTFSAPGIYSVTLTVTDNRGAQNTVASGISVSPVIPPPQIGIQSVQLFGTISDPNVTQVTVNGVPAPVSSGQFNVAVPMTAGTSNITIQANGEGGTTTKAVTVMVP